MKRFAVVLIAMAAGCTNTSTNAEVTGWPFDPVAFFAGHTHGDATLHKLIGSPQRISVDSHGLFDGRGGLVLDQTIREDGKRPRTRRWTIQPAGPGQWTGTLTDAAGPVVVRRTSVDVTIRYRMKNGAAVEQHLEQPPGGAVDNHMIVSRFGVRMARLDEQIRKLPS